MVLIVTISAILAIIAGLLILIWPRTLNLAIAIWLIVYGILQLLQDFDILGI
ncbi:DUF3096 domain-containing protein [Candidatus Pacearchaeota archaeon]|nr:DUF3096 domain-containing protein [Candidatus Pacearchaeota archaeon]